MQSVKEFALACMSLDSNAIYELFEDSISQQLRDKIYCWSEEGCAEPARDALNKIGTYFGVQTLVNY